MDIRPFSDYDLLPVYMRVADDLRSKLGAAGFEVGQLLPSEKELSEAYQLSRGTIRKALGILASEGRISRQPGVGTVILPFKDDSENRYKIAVLWSIVRWIGSEMLEGIEQVLSEEKSDLLFYTSQHNPTKEAEILEHLLRTDIDGLILYFTGEQKNIAIVDRFLEKGVPVVLHDRFTEPLSETLSWVTSDNYTGAYDLTRHLLQLGHERIAYVTWTPETAQISSLQERRTGYETAVREAELEPMVLSHRLMRNDIDRSAFAQKLKNFVDIHKATAIFFCNDVSVYRLYPIFNEWGMRIPDDMSIAGFDGLDVPFDLSPFDLTTVDQDFARLGRESAYALLRCIREPNRAPIHTRIPVSIHVGDTTAICKQDPNKSAITLRSD